jgi:hypothetical protein
VLKAFHEGIKSVVPLRLLRIIVQTVIDIDRNLFGENSEFLISSRKRY